MKKEEVNRLAGDAPDAWFDVVYSLLAFHHLPYPCRTINQVLKDQYLRETGGRVVIMDYEQDPNKQIFHPVHLKKGQAY